MNAIAFTGYLLGMFCIGALIADVYPGLGIRSLRRFFGAVIHGPKFCPREPRKATQFFWEALRGSR